MPESVDVVIVGAGPAGLAAAQVAAESDRSVMLVDDNPRVGGQIWRHPSPRSKDCDYQLECLAVRIRGCTKVLGLTEEGRLVIEGSVSSEPVAFNSLVLATGARERFLPFPGWTLPNVVGAGGLQALVKSGLPIEGKRVVVAGSGPLLLAVASYLRTRGADVISVLEQAPRSRRGAMTVSLWRHPRKAFQGLGLMLDLKGVPYLWGAYVERANGDRKLESVVVRAAGQRRTIKCDYLAIGYDLIPNTELAEILGCDFKEGFVQVGPSQETSVPGVFAAGEVTGIGGLEKALREGTIAGYAASGRLDLAAGSAVGRGGIDRFSELLRSTFSLRHELFELAEPDTIVCRCEDVQLKDLEPFASCREAKLQTRCGMGPCQGRICGPILEAIKGWKRESVRPPVVACRVGSLIGEESEE